MARKKNPWSKIAIVVAIHKDEDADDFIKKLQKFCGPHTLTKTFVPLGAHVSGLSPQELLQIALLTKTK
jgi:hypothetical protein